jgi:F-type H+-transporting ATPase subunit a
LTAPIADNMITTTRIFLAAILISISGLLTGQETNDSIVADSVSAANVHTEESGKFRPGEFMLEHIFDNHEWHIITIGHTHVSIPLPVILYSKTSGLHFFMSNKFRHGTASYNNLTIALEGTNKGKIVEKTEAGETIPLDFSLTKIAFSLLLSSVLILVIFISVSNKYKRNPNKAPNGLQGALEPIILFVRDDVVKPCLGDKNSERFLPYLLTLFFFILINNLIGLIPIFPGGANVTGNIAVTMVMALFTFFITTFIANKHYWQEIYNAPGVPWWLKFPLPLMPMIEILGLIIKPIVLMVRLFANMTAGHLIALAFVSLIFIFAEIHPAAGYGISLLSCAFSIFMGLLEILVSLIQAYVFTLLSAIYFSMAITEPHGNEHH